MLGTGAVAELWAHGAPSLGLAPCRSFVVLLAENCRIPFDDPNTHLELTMIHEVMVLDHSGPPLGADPVRRGGEAVRCWARCSCASSLPFAVGGSLLGLGVVRSASMLALGVVIGVVESMMARLRLLRMPEPARRRRACCRRSASCCW